MSSLLEWQRAIRTQLLRSQPDAASSTDERLAIHRSTCVSTLTNALRLTYPAVRLLVGDEFFEGAARQFIGAHPPRSAWLDDYGEAFAPFLARFAPAASLAYLADVARVEWAVSRSLHAPDTAPLDLSRLATLEHHTPGSLRFVARSGVNALCLESPADAIWRAVLARDDAAMAAVNLRGGPVYLLIERRDEGVVVQRLVPAAGQFIAALLAQQTLETALGAAQSGGASDHDFDVLLAEHLRLGRFADFDATGERA